MITGSLTTDSFADDVCIKSEGSRRVCKPKAGGCDLDARPCIAKDGNLCVDSRGKWADKKCAKKRRKGKCHKRKIQSKCPFTCDQC